MKKSPFILCLLLLMSCDKKVIFDGPEFYEDGFESYASLNDLLVEDDLNWSFTQQTLDGNEITVDTNRVHSGFQSLHFEGSGTTQDVLSKCSISKQNMAFWDGETMRVTAWYYIEGNAPLEWLFLLDLEEQTAIGAGPGMRVVLVENQLRIEHKFNEPDIVQNAATPITFPRDQWVEIIWEVKLSQKDKGTVKLWQDGELIVEAEGRRTLPEDLLYFQQGTKGMYSSVEFGITANPSADDLSLWVDDVKIERVP